jgi:hypothetical protein
MSNGNENTLTAAQARRLEYSIIGMCVLALIFIFQPFSQLLFSIGCVGVVLGGLTFNLMPFCVAGSSYAKIGRVAAIVAVVFVIAVLLALASAWLYGVYLRATI